MYKKRKAWLSRELPSWTPWVIALVAGVFYFLTRAREIVPGLSATIVTSVLDLNIVPVTGHMLYVYCARIFLLFCPGSPVFGLTLFSIICASLCMATLYKIMLYVPIECPVVHDNAEILTRIGPYVGALFAPILLAVSAPFWQAATRPDSAIFDLLILLTCFLLVLKAGFGNGSFYHIFIAVLLYGLGITEYGGMITTSPLFGLLVLLALARMSKLHAGSIFLLLLAGLIGLSFYLVPAFSIQQTGHWGYGMYESFWEVIIDLWTKQWILIRAGIPKVGFLLVFLVAFLPGFAVAVLAKPGNNPKPTVQYSTAFTVLGLFVFGLIVLLEPFFSPYHFSPRMPILLPYLSIAMWMGYIASFWFMESWVPIYPSAALLTKRFISRMMKTAALLFPVIIMAFTWNRFNQMKPSSLVQLAEHTVNSCESRSAIVTTGILQPDLLRYLFWKKETPVTLIPPRDLHEPFFRKFLNKTYPGLALDEDPEAEIDAGEVLNRLLSEQGPGTNETAFLRPEACMAAGFQPVPNGLACYATKSYEGLDGQEIHTQNKLLFKEFVSFVETLPPSGLTNTVEQYARREYSRAANNLGTSLRMLKQDSLSIYYYDCALDFLPDNPSALLNKRSIVLEELDDENTDEADKNIITKKADSLLHKAHEFAQDLSPIYRDPVLLSQQFGYIYSSDVNLLLANRFRQSGQKRFEETMSQQALLVDKTSTKARENIAKLYISRGDYEKASAEFESLLATDPSSVRARFGLAVISYAKGDMDKVLELLESREIISRPENVSGLLTLAYLDKGKVEPAKAILEKVAQMELTDDTSIAYLAMAAFKLQDLETAKDLAAKGLAINARMIPLHNVMISCLIHEGEKESAILHLRKLEVIYPKNARIPELIVSLAMQMENYNFAATTAKKLLKVDPDNFIGHLALSWIAEEPAKKEDHLRTCILREKHPMYAVALNNLAYLLVEQKNYIDARSYAEEAVRNLPDNDKLRHTLAEAYLNLNLLQEAEKEILVAQTLAPANSNHQLLNAEIYYASGDKESARQLARKALPGLEDQWRRRAENLIDKVE